MRIVIAGVSVIAGTLLVVTMDHVRVPSHEPRSAEEFSGAAAPTWEVVEAESLPRGGELRERLALFDPTPLFLPLIGEIGREAVLEVSGTGTVEDYPPALRFTETAPVRDIIRMAVTASPEGAERSLAATRWFEGMARGEEPPPGTAAAVRAARVDVYRAAEAERVIAVDLVRVAGLVGVAWRPMELSVWIAESGVVAAPVMVKSSGVDEIDERIRSIVARELLPTLLLRPGVYRLEVGP